MTGTLGEDRHREYGGNRRRTDSLLRHRFLGRLKTVLSAQPSQESPVEFWLDIREELGERVCLRVLSDHSHSCLYTHIEQRNERS
jgi:hypothetical protein